MWNNLIYSADVTRRCNNGLIHERSGKSIARESKEYRKERLRDGRKSFRHIINDHTRKYMSLAFRKGQRAMLRMCSCTGFGCRVYHDINNELLQGGCRKVFGNGYTQDYGRRSTLLHDLEHNIQSWRSARLGRELESICLSSFPALASTFEIPALASIQDSLSIP